jgi:hypothetical protein
MISYHMEEAEKINNKEDKWYAISS